MNRRTLKKIGTLAGFSFESLMVLAAVMIIPLGAAQAPLQGRPLTETKSQSKLLNKKPTGIFQEVADQALQAMTKRAEELHIQGVAVVAYIEGDSVKSWASKMTVVGSMTKAPSQKDPGANLLAIAYAKASEMAETLKDSGSGGRPPMTGEFGWQGGVIAKGRTGYLIAAFSGGPSEDDVKVSQTGLEILASKL